MGLQTDITMPWADGTYRFHLDIPRLAELQEKCQAGPPEVLGRLSSGRARLEDWRETIRLGLIGGGAPPAEALRLVERYVDTRPQMEALGVALVVLGAALLGHDPETAPAGKRKRARSRTTAASTSPASEPTPS